MRAAGQVLGCSTLAALIRTELHDVGPCSVSNAGLHCRLKPEHAWFSRRVPKIDVSIVVAFTVDRLEVMLPMLCSSWHGTVSAAVYLPFLANEHSQTERMQLRADAITRIDTVFKQ